MQALGECSEYLKAAKTGKAVKIKSKRNIRKVFTARVNACSKPQLQRAMIMLQNMYKGIVDIKLEVVQLQDTFMIERSALLFVMEIRGDRPTVEMVHMEVTSYVLHGISAKFRDKTWCGVMRNEDGEATYPRWKNEPGIATEVMQSKLITARKRLAVNNAVAIEEGKRLIEAQRRTSLSKKQTG